MSSSPVSTLWDVVLAAPSTGNRRTIYAEQPWKKDSPAVLILIDEEGETAEGVPPGFCYFLEISVCKQIMRGIAVSHPTPQSKFERIVHYAINDA